MFILKSAASHVNVLQKSNNMNYVARIQSKQSVQVLEIPSKIVRMRVSGWPDAESPSQVSCNEDTLTVNFDNGKVRVWEIPSAVLIGTY